MKRAKKKPDNRKRKVLISQNEIESARRESAKEAVTKTGMLYLTALAEKGWSEEEVIDLFETVQRYAQYVDDHLIRGGVMGNPEMSLNVVKCRPTYVILLRCKRTKESTNSFQILYIFTILSNHQRRQDRILSVLFVCAEVYHGEGIRERLL